MSTEQSAEWQRTHGDYGPAIVLQDGQQGVDVDNYAKGDRLAGAAVEGLREIEERTGCEYPVTAAIYHRDDGSAKYLYNGTPGVELRGVICPGVETVSWDYRYLHVGINPDTGKPQRWGWGSPTTGITAEADGPIPAEQWATLPEALEAEHVAEDHGKLASLVSDEQARTWLQAMPEGPMSHLVRERLMHALTDLSGRNGSRHDRTRQHVRQLVEYGAARLPGAETALAVIDGELSELRKSDPSRASDDGEFDRLVSWAAKRCRPDVFHALRCLNRNGGRVRITREEADEPTSAGGNIIFKVFEPSEWTQAVAPPEFVIRKALTADTFGVNAGPKKSLKTHDNGAMALSIATATNLYRCEAFSVPKARKVLYIVGEGGEAPVRRTLLRLARAYGIDLNELVRDPNTPLVLAFGAAPIDGPAFRSSVLTLLDRYQPDVVLIESFYNFHPADVQPGNLYERGQLIDDYHKFIRAECEGATSLLTDHYRSTSAKTHDLDNISMAGQAENADSWITRYHRSAGDVPNGDFYLQTAFSSRQWGGTEWHVDWHLGAFDHDLGAHVGEIHWDVRPATASNADKQKPRVILETNEDRLAYIRDFVRDHPKMTKSECLEALRAATALSKATWSGVWAEAQERGLITQVRMTRPEGADGKTVTRQVWIPGDGAKTLEKDRQTWS
ncbi:AAA family ATPase [Mycolicibacterium rhodesiae]|uniref:AAA family ATPase n=1 Tax=Mycolicibacterium rhodesiae TaxID=36814 RepID=UPI001300CC8D|nr:AAA family ATPase [Mycolicibacterium rhodesiae]